MRIRTPFKRDLNRWEADPSWICFPVSGIRNFEFFRPNFAARGDFLLAYKLDDGNKVVFVRAGPHSELFNEQAGKL